jgi:hypothetical protein
MELSLGHDCALTVKNFSHVSGNTTPVETIEDAMQLKESHSVGPAACNVDSVSQPNKT